MTNKFNDLHDNPSLFIQVPIVALNRQEVNSKTVYNLSVENKEEFVANGILVHNCSDCLKYSEKIKRSSYWKKIGAEPQSQNLSCQGYNCDCKFKKTEEKLSRGYLTPPTNKE